MNEAIRHYADEDSYYNGTEGRWTICGLEWSKQPEGVVTDCPECVRLRRQRVVIVSAEWR